MKYLNIRIYLLLWLSDTFIHTYTSCAKCPLYCMSSNYLHLVLIFYLMFTYYFLNFIFFFLRLSYQGKLHFWGVLSFPRMKYDFASIYANGLIAQRITNVC